MEVPYLKITGIKIGEFEVDVPTGLSELVNNGAWGTKKDYLKGYIRKVEMREGKIFTVLKKIS